MRNVRAYQSSLVLSMLLVLALLATACQGMDRLEPDRVIPVGEDGSGGDERGTLLDATSGPDFGGGKPLTMDIVSRWMRQIEAAKAEERLLVAAEFLREYPEAEVISDIHELVGDAHDELGDPRSAAAAWERAVEMSWPDPEPDLLRLPLVKLELPYRIGWAHFEAGDAALGADWLARATVISDRPQLEQGLRFLFAELGSPGEDFEAWLDARRRAVGFEAPDFELPGYQTDSVRFSERESRLTLINFWTPT